MRNVMRYRQQLLAIFALFTLCASGATQTASPRTVVRAGKLLDVKTGKIQTDQAIVIESDKIVSIGPASALKISSADHARSPMSNPSSNVYGVICRA